jgi:hypothetical protein
MIASATVLAYAVRAAPQLLPPAGLRAKLGGVKQTPEEEI